MQEEKNLNAWKTGALAGSRADEDGYDLCSGQFWH